MIKKTILLTLSFLFLFFTSITYAASSKLVDVSFFNSENEFSQAFTRITLQLEKKKNTDIPYEYHFNNNSLELLVRNAKLKVKHDYSKDSYKLNITQNDGNIILKVKSDFTISKNYVIINKVEKDKFSFITIDIYKEPILARHNYSYLEHKVIVIDPGHGGSDSGAIGPNKLMEKDVTLAIAKYIQNYLKGSSTKVILTRNEDRDVYGPHATAKDELFARANIANQNNADALISIHCNSFTNPAANGTQTFYNSKSISNKLLADFIQEEMVKNTKLRDRGISDARFLVLRYSQAPAVLVETAFISNPNEEALLRDPAFQQNIANNILNGLNNYFKYKEKFN